MNSSEEHQNLEIIREFTRWYLEKGEEFDYIPEEKRESEEAQFFLLKAEGDLKTARILFKKKIYDDTIYHTQQSVEKIGKSILLAIGFASIKEFKKKYGHDFSIGLFKKLKRIHNSFTGYTFFETYLPFIKKLDRYLDSYNKRKQNDDLVQSIDELKELFENYENVFTSVMDIFSPLTDIEFPLPTLDGLASSNSFRVMIDELEEKYQKKLSKEGYQQFSEEFNQKVRSVDQFQVIVITIAVVTLLYYISILSFNLAIHYERCRYPEKSEDLYTKENEIVLILPTMFKTISTIIEHYYYLLSINNNDLN